MVKYIVMIYQNQIHPKLRKIVHEVLSKSKQKIIKAKVDRVGFISQTCNTKQNRCNSLFTSNKFAQNIAYSLLTASP